MTEEWKQWTGQVVDGEFHLRQYLGGSDHGAVFLTERGEQRQKAAIKLISVDSTNADSQLSRWKLAGKLSHPHLLRLFQMGRCQVRGMALLYVVMEYAEENLSQVLPQRPLTPAESRDMLPALLDALAYLHRQGFVHGHIKPANIMAVDDQLRLSSDGIRGLGEQSGGRGGDYDAPKTASGRTATAGDVWSLGMTMVEALTQRLPVWARTDQGDPVLPATLPEPFRDIASHCLRRDPENRWTVAEIASRLQPDSSVPQTPTDGTREVFAKWGYMVPLIAACLALMAALAGPRLLNRHQEAQPAPAVALEPPKVEPKPKPSPVTPDTTPHTGPSDAGLSGAKPSPRVNPPSPAALRPVATAKLPASRVVPGEVLQQVSADVSQAALNTIQGTVRVKVRVAVDSSGKIVGATFDSPGPSKYFASRALQAARGWEFSPAEVDGRKVASEWVVRFEFARASAKAFPTPAVP